MSGTFEDELEKVRRAMEEREQHDRRLLICACGHPVQKHGESRGRALCNALRATCPCREVVVAVKASNARVFCFKTDEAGPALLKGWLKSVEAGFGERLEWCTTCCACGAQPVTVVAVDEGKRHEPRCGVHK